jgi:hypothetical protein
MSEKPPVPTIEDLLPGDCLLYAPGRCSLFGWVIAFKTWHMISHCESYIGEGHSVASRDGIGVGTYPTRLSNLTMVLRPLPGTFSLPSALIWYLTVKGQKYDFWGLLRFAWRSKVIADAWDRRQFCSEFLTRWYRNGGLDPFPDEDADAIAPFQLSCTPALRRWWKA